MNRGLPNTEGSADQPMLAHVQALATVSGTLLVLAVFWSTVSLYDAGLLPNRQEAHWQASQAGSRGEIVPMLDDKTSITIERQGCFGTCPEYRLTIYGSGRVSFVGTRFVCVKTPQVGRIDAELVRRLVHGLLTNGFFDFPDFLRSDVTDDATVITTVSTGMRTHTVRHYLGDLTAPRLLTWMERRIDEVAGTKAWTGVLERSGRVCTLPDGTKRSVRSLEPELDLSHPTRI